jgi:hypothetical protein
MRERQRFRIRTVATTKTISPIERPAKYSRNATSSIWLRGSARIARQLALPLGGPMLASFPPQFALRQKPYHYNSGHNERER